MRAAPLLALALAGLALAGCETTQERSAKLEKVAKRRAVVTNVHGLQIAAESKTIEVVSAAAVHSSEGTAAVVELKNSSAAAKEVPLLVSVAADGNPSAYSNSTPGLARSLISLSYIPAHGAATWIDDQVQLTGTPGKVTAKVGAAKPATGAPPAIEIASHKLEEEDGGLEAITGTVVNRSKVDQRELVVYAVAKKGSRVVAAGRSVIAALPAGETGHFQIFLLGTGARGATLTLSAPPSTFE